MPNILYLLNRYLKIKEYLMIKTMCVVSVTFFRFWVADFMTILIFFPLKNTLQRFVLNICPFFVFHYKLKAFETEILSVLVNLLDSPREINFITDSIKNLGTFFMKMC